MGRRVARRQVAHHLPADRGIEIEQPIDDGQVSTSRLEIVVAKTSG